MFTYYCKHENILSVAFSPDGSKLLTAGADGLAKLWDIATSRLLLTFEGHDDFVLSAVFSPDGRSIATASADRTARVWDASSGVSLWSFTQHTGAVWSAVFSLDGAQLLTAGDDGIAYLIGCTDPHPVQQTFNCGGAVRHAVFSPGGSSIATATNRGEIQIWSGAMDRPASTHTGGESVTPCVAFSPNEKRILTTMGSKVILRGIDDENVSKIFSHHKNPITSASFSPCGQLVLTTSLDGRAALWRAETGEELQTYPYVEAWFDSHLNCSAFSAASPRIATGGVDDIAVVWDISPYVDSKD